MVDVRRVQVRNLISKSGIGGGFAINPYVGCPHKCVYCYAACINYSGVERGEEWGTYLDVKEPTEQINLAKVFRKGIFFSSMTDAYNPYEEKEQAMRRILRMLIPAEPRISILTKSKLAVRDIDLFRQFKRIIVSFSFSSLDDSFRRRAEPHASSPAEKLEAIQQLSAAGIAVGAFIAPIFPEISNPLAIAAAAGPYVKRIWFDSLHLRPQNREKVLALTARIRPELTPLYDDIYRRNNKLYWVRLRKEIKDFCGEKGFRHAIFF